MCGIAGRLGSTVGTSPDDAILSKMCSVMTHRGPDDEGHYVREGIAMGMRRLSIIDLATGQQPIGNEDGSVQVVCNGEIYNYIEIRKDLVALGHDFKTTSDTEVIVHAYEQWGDSAVERFRGMFAIALWDSRSRNLILWRDRLGKKPLYYWTDGNRFVFGSELKVVLQDPTVPREMDYTALSDFLTLQYVPGPRSIFKGIYKLPPAHLLKVRFDERRLRVSEPRRYWSPKPVHRYSPSNGTGQSSEPPIGRVDDLWESFKEAVRIRLRSDVPLGTFLSGGLDSTAIVAATKEVTDTPPQTFSVGFDDKIHNELPDADIVSKYFGTKHHVLTVQYKAAEVLPKIIWHCDEPFADSSAVPTWYVSKMAASQVKVALSGDGGDELFAGYYKYNEYLKLMRYMDPVGKMVPDGLAHAMGSSMMVKSSGRFANLVRKGGTFFELMSKSEAARFSYYLSAFPELSKSKLLSPDINAEIDRDTGRLSELNYPFDGDRINDMLYLDLTGYLPDDLLVKADRMSMAHSLEVRSPFLDQELVSQVMQMPGSWKMQGSNGKLLLKQMLAGKVPDHVLSKPKKGFAVPLTDWLRGGLRPLLEDSLSSLSRRGLMNKRVLDQLTLEFFADKRDHKARMWQLLSLELWLQTYVDPETPAEISLSID